MKFKKQLQTPQCTGLGPGETEGEEPSGANSPFHQAVWEEKDQVALSL